VVLSITLWRSLINVFEHSALTLGSMVRPVSNACRLIDRATLNRRRSEIITAEAPLLLLTPYR
jgi:hypothetical protein